MITGYLHRRWLVFGAVVLTAGILATGVVPGAAVGVSPAHAADMPMDGGHMHGSSSPYLWWIPIVMPVLWLGILVSVVYLLYRFIDSAASNDAGMEELDRAFARGELSEEEYERRRERLKS